MLSLKPDYRMDILFTDHDWTYMDDPNDIRKDIIRILANHQIEVKEVLYFSKVNSNEGNI